jgi:hypothetical protein
MAGAELGRTSTAGSRDLAAFGEPVRPDAVDQELDVADLVRLGPITVGRSIT